MISDKLKGLGKVEISTLIGTNCFKVRMFPCDKWGATFMAHVPDEPDDGAYAEELERLFWRIKGYYS
jgi:hypothetical protein